MEERTVPPKIEEKMHAWRYWSSVWNYIHYVVGFSSTALSAVVAANTIATDKNIQLMSSTAAMSLAALAAGLAFVMTTAGAQAKGAAFEAAARELEKAVAAFRDPTREVSAGFLSQAEERGIDLLKKH
jgi:hypothetical protein